MTSGPGTDSSQPASPAAPIVRSWSGDELITGSGLIVLLVSLFLPWFNATVRFPTAPVINGSATGPSAHGYLWIVFALAILALVALVTGDLIGRLPGNLPSADQMLTGATGLALVLTILGVVSKPTGPLSLVSWSYGGFVAVLAAAVAFVAALGPAAAMKPAKRARAVWRRPSTGN
jgi:uncharacterized membrane protein